LHSFLCLEHQEAYPDLLEGELVDWVDPETAEVQQVDGLQHILITHCAREDDFIDERITLVDGVFRLLLANGNTAMTPVELADRLGRSPDIILQTLSGRQVYKGLRPCPGC
jgi:hypothetical protein